MLTERKPEDMKSLTYNESNTGENTSNKNNQPNTKSTHSTNDILY